MGRVIVASAGVCIVVALFYHVHVLMLLSCMQPVTICSTMFCSYFPCLSWRHTHDSINCSYCQLVNDEVYNFARSELSTSFVL